jgi:hypothetical protein
VLAVVPVDLRLEVVTTGEQVLVLGLRSVTTLSTPAQKLSGSISVPGSASLLMKSYNTWATRRFPTVTRSVMFPP